MLNWKKAQAMVEFAVIIPLFIMLIMGIMYSGMIFADYMSFNNIARSSAHEASLSEHYDDIYAKHTAVDLPAGLYDWDNNNRKDFNIETLYDSQHKINGVKVTIHASVKKDNSVLVMFSNFLGKNSLFDVDISYQMYKQDPKN